MLITRIEYVPLAIPTLTGRVRENLLVKVHTDEGIVGYGEGLFGPDFHGETQESVMGVIRKLSSVLINEDPFNIELLEEKVSKSIKGNANAKALINMALYDIVGKKLKTPLYKLLGGKFRNKIPITYVITDSNKPKEVVEKAKRAVEKGYKVLKIKVGETDPNIDVERVKAIRKELGSEVGIRIDANQAWSPHEAVRIMRKISRYNPQYLEQPVPSWDLDGLAYVKRKIDTPIMADESLFSLQDALKLVEKEAVDLFNTKVLKGGLSNLKKISAVAEAAGIHCMVGGAWLSVSAAAGLHFAASTKSVKYSCEFCGEMFYGDVDIVKERVKPQDGYVELIEKPGLGVELDKEKINKLRVL